MELDRINPVTLITGAASGLGEACAHDLAQRSEGGLILVDTDEAALDAVCNALTQPPERVSTLAFDVTDPERWAQATQFIRSQYGRLDWAIVSAGAAPRETDLVDWSRRGDLDGAVHSLQALIPLMQSNAQGGAIIVTAPTTALNDGRPGLLPVVRTATQQSPDVRVNAIASGPGVQAWRAAPLFSDLVRDQGGARGAFDAIAKMSPPVTRYAAADDVSRLIVMLLSDANPITGATLVVDGGYAI